MYILIVLFNNHSNHQPGDIMNIAHLSGNLATDIELLRFDDKSLCKFTLAVNYADRATFLPVEVWNREHLPDYLEKGSRALVSGYLKQEHWDTDKGERRSRIALVAHQVEFLDKRNGSGKSREPKSSQPNNRPPNARRHQAS